MKSLSWVLWPIASFPVAVLSHEAAHYACYRLFGFVEPALHYGSASYARSNDFWRFLQAGDVLAASAIVKPWHAGAAALAGILSTYGLIVICVLVARRHPHPFIVGLGLVSPLRFLGSLFILVSLLAGKGSRNGSDEAHVAAVFATPEVLLHVVGVVVLIISWIILLRSVPSTDKRRPQIVRLLIGIVLGGVLYIGLLGPRLLP